MKQLSPVVSSRSCRPSWLMRGPEHADKSPRLRVPFAVVAAAGLMTVALPAISAFSGVSANVGATRDYPSHDRDYRINHINDGDDDIHGGDHHIDDGDYDSHDGHSHSHDGD